MILTWLGGLFARRRGHIIATATGVALAVGLLGSIGTFIAASKATMTRRAIADVAIDWQIETANGADPQTLLQLATRNPAVATLAPVEFAHTTGLTATTGPSTQTTGPGTVVGLASSYRTKFPTVLRTLAGASDGVLVAQQTAANLHVAPGDMVSIGRDGDSPILVRVDGIVDVTAADAFFQTISVNSQTPASAPPDNVVFLPDAAWHMAFDSLVARQSAMVSNQVQVRIHHELPADPSAAYAEVLSRARHLDLEMAGTGRITDNLAVTLAGARSDALYAQVLFVFLGVPGIALAGLVTAAIAASSTQRRRREQALLRARGATITQLLRLALAETVLVGLTGDALGIALALLAGQLAFHSVGFGASATATATWIGLGAAAGLAVAAWAIAVPAWRDARALTVAHARRAISDSRTPRWMTYGLDIGLLAAGSLIAWRTSRNGYSLVVAVEGTPTVSVSYWALLGPGLLWIGAGLLIWRLTLLALRARRLLAFAFRPIASKLAGTVAATLRRQGRAQARVVSVVALTVAFAASTAVFNATFNHQAKVDAFLTNGADVTATPMPGVTMTAPDVAALATIPGVHHVEALQHRYAYVGGDLQDLFGVNPSTIIEATKLQDIYFAGGSASHLIGELNTRPDGVLVSAETAKDYLLQPGDAITLRLRDGPTNALTNVTFHYVGVIREFPTAPRDSFLVANSDYVARVTGDASVGAFLIDTGGHHTASVAAAVQTSVKGRASVTDLFSARSRISSTLTAVDLSGLTKVELTFALALAAAAAGLALWLGLADRRRTFAIASALGATRQQLGGFIWSETLFGIGAGAVAGSILAAVISNVLVAVLSGVFDPPPSSLSVPWRYLGALVLAMLAAVVASTTLSIRSSRRDTLELIREF